MMQKTRNGILIEEQDGQEKLLMCLYGSVLGRFLLKGLTAPWISRCAGSFLSTKASCCLIKPFVRKNHIDMSQFLPEEFASYNAFFSRSIRPDARPIDMDKTHLISPCDSKLTVMPIQEGSRFTLKNTPYTLESMLQDPDLAKCFQGGQVLVFRLTVDDYHRYCYFDDGRRTPFRKIPGVLHTVNPIANDVYPIYKENAREYTVIHTESFGSVIMMEVGALLVGKIVNHTGNERVRRGQEKGYFQFGGSTVVLILPRDSAVIDEDILENSRNGIETIVRYGEKIGSACRN